MKLTSKASLLIIAIVVILFGPLSSVLIHFQEQALRAAAFNAVDSVVKSSAMLASSFAEGAQRDANAVAAMVPLGAIRSKHMAELDSHLRRAYGTLNFRNGIFVMNPLGEVIVDYPHHPEVRGRPLAYREYFRRTMTERQGVMSAPYVSVRTGKPVLTFTAPVFDERQAIVAVVACSHDLLAPDFLGGIRQQGLGRTGYVYLFDRSRLMILHPEPDRILKQDIPVGANQLLDSAVDGFEGTGATVNSKGIRMLASFRQVPGTPWILGAQIPEAEAFEATKASRRLMLMTTALSLFFILGVGVITVRRFSAPLRTLHQAARAITLELQGGTAEVEVGPLLASIRGRDEIGTLALAFQELVERQQQSLGLLNQAAREWERTFDAVNDAILCLDESGRVLRINRMAADLFRTSADDALGQSGQSVVFGKENPAVSWPEAAALDSEHDRTWTSPLPHREGIFEFRAVPVVQEGALKGMILAVRDVTEQVRKEEDIRRQAFIDALTGLPNRTLLMDRLQQALAANERTRKGVGVLFLDLDHFKQVNDTHGHEVGDALLRETARRLGALMRKNDTVARLGGDEFVMVVSEVGSPEDAVKVANKVLQSLAATFFIGDAELHVGTSIGIAVAPQDGTDGPTLIKNADAAMYQAKRGGRSSFREFFKGPSQT
jgi:diguanylate cyclase (GGDEF)-like protein/PAS domain S-box-containing protein